MKKRFQAVGGAMWERSWALYDRLVLRSPRASLLTLAALTLVSAWGLRGFRADASGDSLVLEHDDDVQYYRAVSGRYDNSDFMVVAYQPPEGVFAKAALDRLKGIRDEIRHVPGVSSVVTVLDVPLLRNPPGPIKDLTKNIKTLEHPKASLPDAIQEFQTSPVYQDQLVSGDGRSTALQVNFLSQPGDRTLVERRAELRDKAYRKTIAGPEVQELHRLEADFRAYKDRVAAERHGQLAEIRRIIRARSGEARFFLGGIPLIIDDIMGYIQKDVVVFGTAITLFIMATLYLIYGSMRWVLLLVAGCALSVVLMMGGMGYAHWDVTVVSANFVTLQLILSVELAIYILSKYRELLDADPGGSNHDLVLETVKQAFIPAFYMKLTTVVGFESLIFCDILPVVQFGWIMTLGVIVSMVAIYWLVPAAMVLWPKPASGAGHEWGDPLMRWFARFTMQRRPLIYAATAVVAVGTAVGMSRLRVENSFIDYFHHGTEIHKGLRFIDENFGGTTSVEVILQLGAPKSQAPAPSAAAPSDSDFSDFGEYREPAADAAKYWFTAERIAAVERVHDYLSSQPEVGKVLSLATLKKAVVQLNGGRPLDDLTLAFLYQSVGSESRGQLVSPYVSVDDNEARITARIRDTIPGLNRAELIARIRQDLAAKAGLKPDQFRVCGLMVLYNNLLQSLYTSQIKSIGFSMLVLFAMLWLLFRSFTISLVALLPQALASLTVLGVMGLAGISLDVMTITIVAVAMGIAVNNTIQYLYRFEAQIREDGDYVKAMEHCHMAIGNPIFYTCLTITVGFAILAASKFMPTVMFGLLIGLAMAVAFATSLSLLPALLLWVRPFGPGR